MFHPCTCRNISLAGKEIPFKGSPTNKALLIGHGSIKIEKPDQVLVHYTRNPATDTQCAELLCKKCHACYRVIQKINENAVLFRIRTPPTSTFSHATINSHAKSSMLKSSSDNTNNCLNRVPCHGNANNINCFTCIDEFMPDFLKQYVKFINIKIKTKCESFELYDTDLEMMFTNQLDIIVGSCKTVFDIDLAEPLSTELPGPTSLSV
ncbi:hypothetical protein TRFO_03197 [Tritrichomonas foetus]|uniref:Uncharacterized protein n=1 Tax=Tritrichomonas foetus TaxID=1144522 RepID=A0A1J4KS82_9EUKA|nr:hypothetical protein TRFO_03197 [Tritrichomonas foetus]|eukprot:OHT14153.1 hypothetical protein TRFO_03197 [Tritrichomonas foetus]